LISLIGFILFSSALYINFRFFEIWKIDRWQAIGVNYLVCSLLGYYLIKDSLSFQVFTAPWLLWAVFLGLLFLTNFFLTGLTVQKLGLTIASVATKISLVIPFVFSILVFGSSDFTLFSVLGLILALFSIWFISDKGDAKLSELSWYSALPLVIFVITGSSDVLSQWCNFTMVPPSDTKVFVWVVFVAALLFSLPFVLYRLMVGESKFQMKGLLGGLTLGIPNYFSYLFLIITLEKFNNKGDFVFPIGNMGVILITSIIALFFFKDTFSKRNFLGLGLALLALAFLLVNQRI